MGRLERGCPVPRVAGVGRWAVHVLDGSGVEPPSAVAPGLDGSVNFEWHAPDGTFCEVEVLRPFYAEVMLIEPGQPARHWTLPTD